MTDGEIEMGHENATQGMLMPPPENPEQAKEVNQDVRIPRDIIHHIERIELRNPLPKGKIAYLDVEKDPDTLYLFEQKDWKPVREKGKHDTERISQNLARRFSRIVIKTPPRDPDNSYDKVIEKASALLGINTKEEERITVEQRLGTVMVVEDRIHGEDEERDERKGWRIQQLTKLGIKVDNEKGEEPFVPTTHHLITFGRRHMKHRRVDLTKGPKSQYIVPDFLDRIKRDAGRLGLEADTTELEQELKASPNPRRTMENARTGTGGVIHKIPGTNDTFTRNNFGEETVVPNRDAFSKPEEEKEPTIDDNRKDNFKFVGKHEIGHTCDVCSHKLTAYDYQEPGRKKGVWFNKREEVCTDHGIMRANVDMGYQYTQALEWKDKSA